MLSGKNSDLGGGYFHGDDANKRKHCRIQSGRCHRLMALG